MIKVLFVCVGNSCRSQMAEAFTRAYGQDLVTTASAGLSATHTIARDTLTVMSERGFNLAEQFPKDFEVGIASKYDVVVNMSGFELPPLQGPSTVEWNVPDPYGAEIAMHRQIRDEIDALVQTLIADLRLNGTVTKRTPVGQRIAPEVLRRPRLWQRFTKWL